MVFYELLFTAKNTATIPSLANLTKSVAHKVVENGGIVRAVRNHGIREVPHRFKAKTIDRDGNRYFKRGRFVSVWYDANPKTMREVEGILRMDDIVLRQTHLKAHNKCWYVNILNEKKNPYIQKVLWMEGAEERMRQKEGEGEKVVEGGN